MRNENENVELLISVGISLQRCKTGANTLLYPEKDAIFYMSNAFRLERHHQRSLACIAHTTGGMANRMQCLTSSCN
jgi:hypothetical protein